MVPRQLNARGFTDPLRPCGPSLRPPRGPDVCLTKILTFCWGDAAARAVIGPLTNSRRRTKTGPRLRLMRLRGPHVAWRWDHNQPFSPRAHSLIGPAGAPQLVLFGHISPFCYSHGPTVHIQPTVDPLHLQASALSTQTEANPCCCAPDNLLPWLRGQHFKLG